MTELAELPSGLKYSEVPSQMIAAASCILIAIIDTWSGEFGSAHRYNLRAIISDPLWSESFLPKSLIKSLAGEQLEKLNQITEQKIKIESTKYHDFTWQKIGTGIVGGAGALFAGIMGQSGAIGAIYSQTTNQINKFNTSEAQQEAREKEIKAIKEDAVQKKREILKTKAIELLAVLGG